MRYSLLRSRLNILLLCIGVLIAIVYQHSKAPLSVLLPGEEQSQGYDILYLDNIRTRQYNQDGDVAYTMTAEHVTQQANKPYKHLVTPRISYQATEFPWLASADEGALYDDQKVLLLSRDVVIKREQPPLLVTTKTLLVNEPRKLVMTSENIHAQFEQGEISGQGLVWNYEINSLQIMNRVNSIYDAP